MCRGDLRWSNPFQIEKAEAERWGQEGGLQVHGDQNSDPEEVNAHLLEYRGNNRNDNKGDLNKVDEKSGNKNNQHDDKKKVPRFHTGTENKIGDVAISTHPPENQSKSRCSDNQDKHHTGEGCGASHHFP